jgi:uncharacterized protein
VTATVPIVDYLCIDGDQAHLTALACDHCGARYFDHREACASCSRTTGFSRVDLPTEGTVASFTIVHRGAPGVRTPFVSALVRLSDGTAVRTNLVGCPPDPDHVRLGMPVRLVTYHAGVDDEGTIAVAFAFAPTEEGSA